MGHRTPAARPGLAYRLADRVKAGPLPRLAFRGHNAVLRLIRPVTLGVRMMILDWRPCLPGPPWLSSRLVSCRAAGSPATRRWSRRRCAEAREEAAIEVLGGARFVGIYANLTREKSDHVALFLAERWRSPSWAGSGRRRSRNAAFFGIDALPEDTSDATRRRLAEVIDGHPPTPDW